MVPKLHRGTSFHGLANYVLHDKGRATTAHRLAWTETRNLATDHPETAWRVMAATAMDQDRLKAAAGVKNTGRKSKEHVLHLMLSWHPDESASVSRDEMMRAALGAIRALKADEYQALIVSHNDEPQAHVHVILNRVCPTDGRMLSSSKEKLALSRWAERYEKERGRVFCEERVLNNASRDRGEFVRGERDQARHLFEQKAVNENHLPPANVLAEEKRKDAAVSKKAREIRTRHAAALKAIDQAHRDRVAAIRAGAREALAVAREVIRQQFRPEWRGKLQKDTAELESFEAREMTLFGWLGNAFKAIDFGRIIRGEGGRSMLRGVFEAFSNAGARREGMRQRQEAGDRAIVRRQKSQGREKAAEIRKRCQDELAQARALFVNERQTLELKQAMETAALRTEWKTRREQRAAAWRRDRSETEGRKHVTPDRDVAAEPADLQTAFAKVAKERQDQTNSKDTGVERRCRSERKRPRRLRRPRDRDDGMGRERE